LIVVSSKVGRKKKESGDSSVNGYLWLWLTCLLLSACLAGGFIYADFRSELNTHLALEALFTQSSPGQDLHCYKLSLFQAHRGR
jgi:hypothetical protein